MRYYRLSFLRGLRPVVCYLYLDVWFQTHRAHASHQPLPRLKEPAQTKVNEGEAAVIVGGAEQEVFGLVVEVVRKR